MLNVKSDATILSPARRDSYRDPAAPLGAPAEQQQHRHDPDLPRLARAAERPADHRSPSRVARHRAGPARGRRVRQSARPRARVPVPGVVRPRDRRPERGRRRQGRGSQPGGRVPAEQLGRGLRRARDGEGWS
ncbi:uncharacterized protein PG986_011579 [Apiospora aurea]|uniref:Uncharacterized protein n=1 Tax=Apiospora aurea TaxID=335848 RepID=A0ABR1PXL0_9PEZI